MITVSTQYDNIIAAGGHYEWQVYNNGTTFGKEHIVSGTMEYKGWDKQLIGNVIAAQLNLTLWNVTIDTDYPIYMQFRATDGVNNSAWYAKTGFYVDTIETNPYTQITEITAFDAMLKTETDYMPSGSFVPISAKDLADQIATDIGLTLSAETKNWLNSHPYTFSNAPNVGKGGTTDKEMLSYIGVIYGGNWVVRGNTLKMLFPQYTPNDTANVGNALVTLKQSDTEVIKRVKLWLDYDTYYLAPQVADEPTWLALGGRCIEAQLPFYATQTIADNIATEYGIGGSTRSYIPYTADKVYIDPKYEEGDGVTFATGVLSFTSRIASMTTTIDPLAAADLEFEAEETLNSLYPYISKVERDMIYEIGQTQTEVANANSQEQIIYISAPSGTNTMSANTTWVTDATGSQNTWTTVRPVYDSSYPVLFVATQRQSVSQSSGTACTCTTPAKDQTTTVIDGGHITTGTIDASVVNVTNINADNIVAGTISDDATPPKNYWDLTTGQFVTAQGSLGNFTIDQYGLYSGSTAVENDGTLIKPGQIMITDYNSLNQKTLKVTMTSGGLDFEAAQGNGSYVDSGTLMPTITANGYGSLNIYVDPTDPANIALYDASDTSHSYKTVVTGNAQFLNDVKIDGNLAGAISTGDYASVANLTAFNNAILTKFGTMSNGQIAYMRLNPSASISPFGGSMQFCKIYRLSSGYGAVETISYQNASGAVRHSASIYNDTIPGWV